METLIERAKNSSDIIYSITNELPIMITALYDESSENNILRNKCLDMWDSLYQSNIGNSRILTQKIMDY